MNSFVHHGKWWVASRPEKEVAGTLSFDQENGLRLSLIGSFDDTDPDGDINTDPWREYPLVLGLTSDGHMISLQYCSVIRYGNNHLLRGGKSHSFPQEELHATYGLLETHFDGPDDVHFPKGCLEFSHAAEWAARHDFVSERIRGADGLRGTHTFTYTPPESVVAATPSATIKVAFEFSERTVKYREAGVKQKVKLYVEATEDVPLKDWNRRFIYPLQTFLSLATDQWNSLDAFGVFSPRIGHFTQIYGHLPDNQDADIPVEIPVYFRPANRSENDNENTHVQPLFRLKDVQDDLSGVLSRWFGIWDRYESACDLFFGVMLTPRMFHRHQFLNIAQAAESFHRAKYPTARRRDEPGYEDQLRNLIQFTADILPGAPRRQTRFVDVAVDTRHSYSHGGLADKANVVHGDDLRQLVDDMAYLVTACFLKELELPSPLYPKMFQDNFRFQRTEFNRHGRPW